MIITTYEEALASIGTPASEIEVAEWDSTIKPTGHIISPVGHCCVEGAILDRQAAILFE